MEQVKEAVSSAVKITKAKQFFIIQKAAGKKVIQSIKRVINHNTVVSVLDCVLIDVDKSGVKFTVTDLENVLVLKPEINTYSGEVSICVNSRYLEWFFNKSITEEIRIEFVGEKCVMSCGKFKVEVGTEKGSNFPKMPTLEPKRNIQFDGKELSPVLLNALDFVSNDDLRPAMTGINFCSEKNKLTIVATDAHRLYFRSLEIQVDEVLDTIFSRKGCVVIANEFKKGNFILEIDATYIRVVTAEVEFISRKIDARYPQWQAVLPKPTVDIFIDRKELLKYLSIANCFCNRTTKQIRCKVNETTISFSTSDEYFNENTSKYEIEISKSKPTGTFEFAINGDFFLRAASVHKEEMFLLQSMELSTKGMLFDNDILLMPLMIHE